MSSGVGNGATIVVSGITTDVDVDQIGPCLFLEIAIQEIIKSVLISQHLVLSYWAIWID